MRENEIITGDCVEQMMAMPKGSVDLCVCDPPYNLGVAYDQYHDRLERKTYTDWAYNWLRHATLLLKPNGSIFVAINDEYVADYKQHLDSLGLTMRNWIIWYYTFGTYATKKFGRDHTHILYYVNNPKSFTFNADAIRIPSMRQEKYGDKRANSAGRIPGDVWQFPRVCGTFKERRKGKGEHPCQMPLAVLERIVLAASNPGDLVFDPMCGNSTTLMAAKKHGRRWLGIELSENYAEGGRERLKEIREKI